MIDLAGSPNPVSQRPRMGLQPLQDHRGRRPAELAGDEAERELPNPASLEPQGPLVALLRRVPGLRDVHFSRAVRDLSFVASLKRSTHQSGLAAEEPASNLTGNGLLRPDRNSGIAERTLDCTCPPRRASVERRRYKRARGKRKDPFGVR